MKSVNLHILEAGPEKFLVGDVRDTNNSKSCNEVALAVPLG
jgi:hypothetical protein